MHSSSNSQIRQYAAILLRRRVNKKRRWYRLNQELRNGLKSSVLKSLQEEPEKPVKNAISQLAGAIAKIELPRNAWPELLQYLHSAITSPTIETREVGIFVMSVISVSAAEQLQPYFKGLFNVLGKTLLDQSSYVIPFYTIKTLTALVYMIGSDEMHFFQAAVPKVAQVIKQLISIDEGKACEALQIFDELIECATAVLAPFVKLVVELCLEIGGNRALGDDIRVKAITLISWLIRLKKKAVVKHKLVTPILKVIFPIMCTPPPSEGNEEIFDDDVPLEGAEASSPTAVSAQVIDILALHVPPEKLLHSLMPFIELSIKSDDPFCRKAAYIALAVTAEGCADFIRKKYLQSYVLYTSQGIQSPNAVIRNASLFAIGQFSEHLQPDIAKFASDILPLLFECLKQTCHHLKEGEKDPPSTTKMFYALENFCECLGKDLAPYVPAIMEQLFAALHCSSIHVQELAISAIGATANAVEEGMLPYFEEIINRLIYCLSQPFVEEIMPVQLQCLDTLGVLARVIGSDKFRPLVPDCVRLGLGLLESVDDPDIRRCTYGLFASISSSLKEEIAPYLPTVIEHMMSSLRSTEGVVIRDAEDGAKDTLPIFDDFSSDEEAEVELGDDDDEDTEDEDFEDDDGTGVENAYLDEKQDTCSALGELAANTGPAFLPFLEKSCEEVYRLLDHPASSVRSEAISALGQFCCTLYTSTQSVHLDDGVKGQQSTVLTKMLSTLLPRLMVMVHEDKERVVVMAALESINELLKSIGRIVVDRNGHLAAIVAAVKDVLKSKVACQDPSETDGLEDISDDQQAEHDAMLLECAGEIVPSLAKAVPGNQFTPYFAGILPLFVPKTRENRTVAEKSFSVGILAESVAAMKEGVAPFVGRLLPVFLAAARDGDEEVRSNAIYGLGVLSEFGQDAIFPEYPTILQLLSDTVVKETDPHVMDNVCAAIARMIIANVTAVPIDQVFPVLLRFLPLRQDFEENLTILKCIVYLLSLKHTQVITNLPLILEVVARVTGTDQLNQESQLVANEIVKEISRTLSTDLQMALNTLDPSLSEKICFIINS